MVIIKNPSYDAVSEIRKWLEDYGYCYGHIFVVDKVFVNVSQKISQKDLKAFKNTFNEELILEGASYDDYGCLKEVRYYCYQEDLKNFRSSLFEWVEENSFPLRFFTVTDGITLYCFDELSKNQINNFEKKFEVKCRSYSISCNSNEITYKFS